MRREFERWDSLLSVDIKTGGLETQEPLLSAGTDIKI